MAECGVCLYTNIHGAFDNNEMQKMAFIKTGFSQLDAGCYKAELIWECGEFPLEFLNIFEKY